MNFLSRSHAKLWFFKYCNVKVHPFCVICLQYNQSSLNFSCKNFVCIRNEWQCDGEDDCGDNSDEAGCQCNAATHFPCSTTNQCIERSRMCDSKRDCNDGSDESNSTCIECLLNEFRCNTSGNCINQSKVCDRKRDCPDKSDEKLCFINECDEQLHDCSQRCVDLRQGYKCACKEGFVLNSDGKTCSSSCDDYKVHRCSQICVTLNITKTVKHVCKCVVNYTLDINQASCKHNSKEEPYLMIANKHYINKLSISRKGKIKQYETINDGLRYAISIDFDWKTRSYYWIGLMPGEVRKAFFDNERKTPISIIHNDLPNPFDLTIDWVANNIYVSDKNHYSIYISNWNGTIRKQLLKNPDDHPLALVCVPHLGYVFFTTQPGTTRGKSTISRIGMDGTNYMALVKANLMDPRGIAVDFTTMTLYWSDMGTKKIQYMSIKKSASSFEPKTLLSSAGEVFSLTLFEDYLYFTTWNPPYRIQRTNRWSGENTTTIKTSTDKFFGIQVNNLLFN